MPPSDMGVIMEQLNLPANTSQTAAYIVNVQGIDVVISLLTVIAIINIFILYFVVKRR